MKLKSTVLIEARALIADPANWSQGEWAKNRAGETRNVMSPDAACFCMFGAIGRILNVEPGTPSGALPEFTFVRIMDRASLKVAEKDAPPGTYISGIDLNDGLVRLTDLTPHQAVLAAFDAAIAEQLAFEAAAAAEPASQAA